VRTRDTYQYAPELGTLVKYDYRRVGGSAANPGQPWELVTADIRVS
jgi:hypothetical protein